MASLSWDQWHKASFPEWLNFYLGQRNLKVEDIERDFCDGVLLINLLEIISQKQIKRYFKNPKFLQQKIDNVNVSIQFLQREMGLTVVGCNPQDIVNGNSKQIMGIIFLLIQYTKHKKSDEQIELLHEISDFSKHLGTDLNRILEKDVTEVHKDDDNQPDDNNNNTNSVEELTPREGDQNTAEEEIEGEEQQAVSESPSSKSRRKKKSKRSAIRKKTISELPPLSQRDVIANEILSTEKSYVNGLTILTKSFLEPAKARNLLNMDNIRKIFSDTEVLKGINEQLLLMLEERMKNWEANNQRLGDIFLKLCEYLKMYTNYVNNYNESIKAVTEIKKKNQKFAEFLEVTRYTPECNGLDLTSFLIMPVQRIPRYVLLLTDLLKNTPEDHSDYDDLKNALTKMKNVADYVNEKKRQAENLNRVLDVQELLQGKIDLMEDASRRYVKEGILIDMSGNEKKNRYYFLFNDLFVEATCNNNKFKDTWRRLENGESVNFMNERADSADGMFKYKSTFTIQNSGLKEPGAGLQRMDPKWKNMFQLVPQLVVPGSLRRQISKSQAFSFLAPTYDIKLNWMYDIDECIMQQLETKRSRLQSPLEENEVFKYDASVKPDIASKLLYQSSKGEYKSKWCVIQGQALFLFNDKEDAEPRKSISILNCSVRLHRPSEREFTFQILTPSRIFIFGAESGELMYEWINTIRSTIEFAINSKNAPARRVNALPPSLAAFLDVPANQVCVDCGQKATSVSPAMGVLACQECSGIHRIFGNIVFHNLKYNVGKLSEHQIEALISKGNEKVNEEFLKNIPAYMTPIDAHTPYNTRVHYITAKYCYRDNNNNGSDSSQSSSPESSSDLSSYFDKKRSIDVKKIAKRGWLLLDKDNTKLQYFFTLKKMHLYYYKTEKGTIKGSIDLQGASVTLSKEEPLDSFEIVSPSRVFHLTAGSSDEAKHWVELITLVKSASSRKKSSPLIRTGSLRT